MEGKVKYFDTRRGYGFIKYKDDEDIFVHFTCIKSDEKFKYLCQSEVVEFSLVKTENGYKAVNVKRVNQK